MLIVSTLGPEATFSHEAALKFLEAEGEQGKIVFCSDIEEVFEHVEQGKSKFGIVPIENSLEGSVGLTLELLLTRHASICREIVIEIKHALLGCENSSLSGIAEVYSHPHALAQCKSFIKKHNLKTRNFSSTAEAAKKVAELKDKRIAAIASERAAEIYGLKIIAKNIQDFPENKTRFIAIAKECRAKEKIKNAKTSIIAGVEDKPGALYELLGVFAKRRINLTKIESRPSRKSLGDYVFFIDFQGSMHDNAVKEAIEEIKSRASFFKFLGSYEAEQ